MIRYSINAGWANGGPDRSRLRYAESDNGINWTISEWVMYGTPGKWDSGGTGRGYSIVLKDGVYHLWYAGTNENNVTLSPFWRIGYAISIDGINWVKQNNGNPVIEPTESWELNNVSFPKVIYDNGVYHMWYAAGSGDAPTQFVYAYSYDGIEWLKPAEENPVLLRSITGFDNQFITQPFVMQDGDIYKMWYSGWNGFAWSIGYATATSIFTPPPPLPTPTPTPLPTPTPTPTPTPPPTNKVVVIPGMGASWNTEAILGCTLDPSVGTWTLNPLAADVYNPILTALQTTALTPVTYYYDWRRRIPDSGTALSQFISALSLAPGERVDMVGHSMGGLVGRAYLEQQMAYNKLDRFMTVGSPHQGTAFAYPAWSGGEIWNDNFLMRVGLTSIIKLCGLAHGKNDRDAVQTYAPSTQQLLPRAPYLRDISSGLLKEVNQMDAQNDWSINPNLSSPFFGVTLGTLSGTGFDSLENIIVKDRNKHDERLGNWADGKPFKNEYTTAGDGTVPLSSSQIIGSGMINRTINQNHAGLIASAQGMSEIISFLQGNTAPLSATVSPAPTISSALLVIGNPANVSVTNPDGRILQDTQGLVAIANPKKGTYSVLISPKTFGKTRFILAQFLADGRTFWKEYGYTGILTKRGTIQFDPDNPTEDALK